jgi:hypothetical protein
MANINVENKYPKGPQEKESLLALAVIGYTRGLFVIPGNLNGSDANHCSLPTAAGQRCIGVIEEDQTVGQGATAPTVPLSIIERGETVVQIGAAVTPGQALTNNAAGQAIPAGPGQPVLAIALDGNPNVGDFITATVTPPASYNQGDAVTHYIVAGAIPVQTGCYGLGSAAALAMTLPAPTALQDGANLFITAETAHAHTITTPANGINGNKHICTFAAQGDALEVEAVGGVWNVRGLIGGAALT